MSIKRTISVRHEKYAPSTLTLICCSCNGIIGGYLFTAVTIPHFSDKTLFTAEIIAELPPCRPNKEAEILLKCCFVVIGKFEQIN